MPSFIRVFCRSFDPIFALFVGRLDKYWSWAVVTVISLAVMVFVVVTTEDRFADYLLDPVVVALYLLPLALVPVRKKWGWPRG